MEIDSLLAQKFAAILPQLNEKQRRLILAAEARSLGHGGISRVARASGVSRASIQRPCNARMNLILQPPRRLGFGGGVVAARERVSATQA